MTNPEKRSPTSSNSTANNPDKALSGEQIDAPENRLACGRKAQSPGSGQTFPKKLRLSGREAFSEVFERGTVATDRMLVVHGIANQREYTRMGLSISRKVGTAPTRNYWKRCIREAFRRNQHRLPISLDIVVRPRRDAHPNYHQIEDSLLQLLKRISRQLQRPS